MLRGKGKRLFQFEGTAVLCDLDWGLRRHRKSQNKANVWEWSEWNVRSDSAWSRKAFVKIRTCWRISKDPLWMANLIVIHFEISGKSVSLSCQSIPAIWPLSVLGNISEKERWKAYLEFYDAHTTQGLACRSWCTVLGIRCGGSFISDLLRSSQTGPASQFSEEFGDEFPTYLPVPSARPSPAWFSSFTPFFFYLLTSLPLRNNLHD